MSAPLAYDVAVIGGGPGGASTATHLARAGLTVGVFERELFPRFHVGESLLPATMLLLDRLGVRERVEACGFQVKYGASFHDQDSGLEHTFYFQRGQPWPNYAFQVPRAEFDALLLDHARQQGAHVYQPATVQSAAFDGDGVTLTALTAGGPLTARARFLVDASGRDGFLATQHGTRTRIPNLGKVALFAHFRGAERQPGIDEGNIRIYVFEDGWFWWIPLAGDLTSVGAVLHARTIRARPGSTEGTYEEMIGRCRRVAEGLRAAQRVTPVRRSANFAYVNRPMVGDRFLAVGDAIAFTDPIFSAGVYIAIRSGELAAAAIARAFADGRFEARRLAAYERAVWRGMTPFFRFIHKYYEPAFLDTFLRPRNLFGMVDGVLNVLSGGSFLKMTWRVRFALAVLFGVARINTWARRRAGLPVESRLEW